MSKRLAVFLMGAFVVVGSAGMPMAMKGHHQPNCPVKGHADQSGFGQADAWQRLFCAMSSSAVSGLIALSAAVIAGLHAEAFMASPRFVRPCHPRPDPSPPLQELFARGVLHRRAP